VVPRHSALLVALVLASLQARAQTAPPAQTLPSQNLPTQSLPAQNPPPEQTLRTQELPTQNPLPEQTLPTQKLPTQNPLQEQTLPTQKLPTQKVPPAPDEPVPSGISVQLQVGQKKVLDVGLAQGLACDDGTIVRAELREASPTSNQLLLKGLKPGQTACRAGTANVARSRVVNITVVPKPAY